MTRDLVISAEAEADIDDILSWSLTRFGADVRAAYERLIVACLEALLADPSGVGTHDREELGHGIRVAHLASYRNLVATGARRVASPRHFVVYREVTGAVQVLRVLHDAMDPQSHLRQ